MWVDYHLRAESEAALLAAVPEDWKNAQGEAVGKEGVALDVIGPAGAWHLANLRLVKALPETLAGMLIEPPDHPLRVFA